MKQSLFSNDPAYKAYTYHGLMGRYAHWPAKAKNAKRTFVIVYGQHSILERIQPIAETLTSLGDVYVVDNPGFGGMDSAFRINLYPDLELYAGHLEHFISEYIPAGRQLTLLGISYGFQMTTELLLNYPKIKNRVETTVSFVGFVHPDNFETSFLYKFILLDILANIGRTRLGAIFLKLIIRKWTVILIYNLTKSIQTQFKSLSGEEARQYARTQALLWTINDHRTHAVTGWDLFKKNDLTRYRLDVPAVHIGVPKDHIFNNNRVTVELKAMFENIKFIKLHLDNHAPLDLDATDKITAIMPEELGRLFSESKNKTAVL